MAGWYRWEDDDLLLWLRVQPKASRDEFAGPHGDDAYRVRITAPPVDGKANAHLIRFLAKAFGVPRAQVTLETGDGSRNKRLRIKNPAKRPISLD